MYTYVTNFSLILCKPVKNDFKDEVLLELFSYFSFCRFMIKNLNVIITANYILISILAIIANINHYFCQILMKMK